MAYLVQHGKRKRGLADSARACQRENRMPICLQKLPGELIFQPGSIDIPPRKWWEIGEKVACRFQSRATVGFAERKS